MVSLMPKMAKKTPFSLRLSTRMGVGMQNQKVAPEARLNACVAFCHFCPPHGVMRCAPHLHDARIYIYARNDRAHPDATRVTCGI